MSERKEKKVNLKPKGERVGVTVPMRERERKERQLMNLKLRESAAV